MVEQEDLHLGRGGACRRIVSDRHHLGDVAGDGLHNVHGCEAAFCSLFVTVCLSPVVVVAAAGGTWLELDA